MSSIKCPYCKWYCCKNGHGRNQEQRYKCERCRKSFTKKTIEKLKNLNDKRVVLHLVLAGWQTSTIAEKLMIQESIIKRWLNLHLKDLTLIIPPKPLISITYLIRIYRGIEKKRISNLVKVKVTLEDVNKKIGKK